MLLLHPYLESTFFKIITDHKALKCILNIADATGKVDGRRLKLSEMEFDVFRCTRIKLQAADTLLRLPTRGKDSNSIDDALPFLSVSSWISSKEKGASNQTAASKNAIMMALR